jgi:hypothetical protein
MIRCILANRDDAGTYSVPQDHVEDDWELVQKFAETEAEDIGEAIGWGKWTRVYRFERGIDDVEAWYFVAEPRVKTVREFWGRHNIDGGIAILHYDDYGQPMLWVEPHEKGLTIVDVNTSAKELGYRDESEQSVAVRKDEWLKSTE